MSATIAEAAAAFVELQDALDDAYWQAHSLEHKDLIYSIISTLFRESAEIAKLSIQDHDLPYEPICPGSKDIRNRLLQLRRSLDTVVLRMDTARDLDPLITQVTAILR